MALIIVGGGGYWYTNSLLASKDLEAQNAANSDALAAVPSGELEKIKEEGKTVMGTSVQRRDIVAHHFGAGEKEVVFVGGIHGGYSWNTSQLAFELMDHLQKNPAAIPAGVKVTVIPVMNPDGLHMVVGTTSAFSKADVSSSQTTRIAGRFNGNNVDLNRNFDCDWKESGTWQNKKVSGGASAFSEPESQAFRNYIESHTPAAVVVFYSAAGGVFPSRCGDTVSSETLILTDAYAKASGYKAFADFDFYEITGDMPNWLAKKGIPAISVLLTSHDDIEWAKNQEGIEAVLSRIAR